MMQVNGIPGAAAKCSVETIAKMKHSIRTVFGDSGTYYGGEKWKDDGGLFPHGNGQGNGDGPALWAAISSPLLKILRDQGFGIEFLSAISAEILVLAAFGFVDDMDYIETGKPGESCDELLHRTQQGMDLWESLLRTTGGAIVVEPGKTDWVKINFEEKNHKMVMAKMNSDEKLFVRNTDGERKQLEQLDVSTARKTLGVMQCVNGDEEAEIKYLLEKIETWKKNIWRSILQHEDIRCAVQATIGKTLSYPLPATAFTQAQCSRISSAFLKTALPKTGVVRSASRQLVFAPTSVMGLGYEDFYMLQLAEHTLLLLDHGNAKTITGQIIRNLAEGTLVENGLGGDIFDMPHSTITWTTHTWLKNTLIGFENSDMSISHTLPQLTLWKDNDVFLIEKFITAKRFSSSQMEILNEVRMYLKVSTLSDITISDGTRFSSWALRVEPSNSCSSQRYAWPNTATPSRKHKELWRSALRMAFARQTMNRIDRNLVTNTWL